MYICKTNNKKMDFQELGFITEYWVSGKLKGTIFKQQKTEIFGYESKKEFLLEEDIVLDNNKKIKKGTFVKTYIVKLNGKKL